MNLDFIQFDNPQALWLLLLVPLYLVLRRVRRTTASVRYPSVRNLKRLPRSFRQRCRVLQPLLRASGLALLIIVLARPIRPLEQRELPSQGIAIAMVVDKSYSMGSPDGALKYGGKLQKRFTIAKDVCLKFIVGDGKDLSGRPNDLIGLFTFATYPETEHPFSLDANSLANTVENLAYELPLLDELGRPTEDPAKAAVVVDQYGRRRAAHNPMQFTDLRLAIEYVAGRLKLLEQDLARDSGDLKKYHLQNKVMVLLTDGEPTVAEQDRSRQYPDEETIRMLTDAGIRVYFIQILSHDRYRERPDGTVEVISPRRIGLFGHSQALEARMVNEAIEEARKLARRTGGEHFLATSGEQLRETYERIDELETSEVGGRTVFSHEERYRPWLWAALGMIAGEALLGMTWLRRAP